MKKEILLGGQLSIAGGLYKALERAKEIGATCVQIFTKSNRQWAAKELTDEDISKFLKTQKDLYIKIVVTHASYLINLGSANKEVQDKSIKALAQELERCEKLHIPYLILHPGSNPSENKKEICLQIAKNIDHAFNIYKPKKTMVLLETMAGQGSTIGNNLENLALIIEHSKNKKHIGVCVDTCHIFAAGYEFDTEKGYKDFWNNFDKIIGISKLKVIHMNDSKKGLGSKVDRHEHIGKGKISPLGFKLIMNDKKLDDVVKIIETPKSDKDLKHDKENLDLLKSYIKK